MYVLTKSPNYSKSEWKGGRGEEPHTLTTGFSILFLHSEKDESSNCSPLSSLATACLFAVLSLSQAQLSPGSWIKFFSAGPVTFSCGGSNFNYLLFPCTSATITKPLIHRRTGKCPQRCSISRQTSPLWVFLLLKDVSLYDHHVARMRGMQLRYCSVFQSVNTEIDKKVALWQKEPNGVWKWTEYQICLVPELSGL